MNASQGYAERLAKSFRDAEKAHVDAKRALQAVLKYLERAGDLVYATQMIACVTPVMGVRSAVHSTPLVGEHF